LENSPQNVFYINEYETRLFNQLEECNVLNPTSKLSNYLKEEDQFDYEDYNSNCKVPQLVERTQENVSTHYTSHTASECSYTQSGIINSQTIEDLEFQSKAQEEANLESPMISFFSSEINTNVTTMGNFIPMGNVTPMGDLSQETIEEEIPTPEEAAPARKNKTKAKGKKRMSEEVQTEDEEENEDEKRKVKCLGRWKKSNKRPTTKNVIKNFANQTLTYARKHSDFTPELKKQAEERKKKVSNIDDLKNILYGGTVFNEEFRKLSKKFLNKKYIRWVFNSQIMEKKYFLEMRKVLSKKCSLTSGDQFKCLVG